MKKITKYWLIALLCLVTVQMNPVIAATTSGALENSTIVSVDDVDELLAAISGAVDTTTIELTESFDSQLDRQVTINYSASFDIMIYGGETNKVLNNKAGSRHFMITNTGTGTIYFNRISFIGNTTSGGVTFTNGRLFVQNAYFENNFGALLSGSNTESLTVEDSTFRNNTHSNGAGAIRLEGTVKNVSVKRSSFFGNSGNAQGYSGGAIWSKWTTNFEVIDSYFEGNKAHSTNGGGGIALNSMNGNGVVNIKNNVFRNNEATGLSYAGSPWSDGGAIFIANVGVNQPITIENNLFDQNIAYDDGGAIMLDSSRDDSTHRIINNTFYKNHALGLSYRNDNPGGYGNSSGAIQVAVVAVVEIEHNTFVENQSGTNGSFVSEQGGAIGQYSVTANNPKVTLTNNLFVENKVTDTTGTVIDSLYSNVSLKDVTASGNIGYDNGTAITEDVSLESILGQSTSALVSAYVSASVGNPNVSADQTKQAYLPLNPTGIAMDGATALSQITKDQIGYTRKTGQTNVGAIESVAITYDSNEGYFDLEEQTSYTGTLYYGEVKPELAYAVAYNNAQALPLTEDDLVPTRDGYTFLGWSTNANSTVADVDMDTMLDFNTTAITLYAIWEDDTVVVDTYTVTYHSTAHTDGTIPTDALNPYDDGSIVTVLGEGSLVKEGYTFKGWSTTSGSAVVAYTAGTTFTITADTDLYAVWEENPVVVDTYTVTYHSAGHTGGSIPTDAQNPYDEGSLITVLGEGSLVRSGYTFKGWSTTAGSAVVAYTAGTTFTITANTYLYAVWEENPVVVDTYTVTYHSAGHTGGSIPTDALNPYDDGSLITVLGEGSLVRSGYTFKGWSTTSGSAVVAYTAGTTFTITGNTDLYAVWEAKGTTNPEKPTLPNTGVDGLVMPLAIGSIVAGLGFLVLKMILKKKEM